MREEVSYFILGLAVGGLMVTVGLFINAGARANCALKVKTPKCADYGYTDYTMVAMNHKKRHLTLVCKK